MAKAPTDHLVKTIIAGIILLAILWVVQAWPAISAGRLLKSPTGNVIAMAIVGILFFAILWWVQSFITKPRENTLGDAEAGISKTLFIFGGIPLVISPCVLMGNVMSLAGHWTGDEHPLLLIVVSFFMAVSSAYPFTYLLCWSHYQSTQKKNITIPLAAIVHLFITIASGVLWGVTDALLP